MALLQGQVTAQRPGEVQPRSLQPGSPVFAEDTIQTQASAKVQMLLIDATELSLGERATMTLSQLVFAPERHTHRGVVSIAQGIFRAVTKTVLPQTRFEIRTGTAVAAVRGTQWLGEVTPESTAIVVIQGEVAVSHSDPSISGTTSLSRGLGSEVHGRTPPTPAKKWAEARVFTLLRATALP
ncbi:MAG: FecR domain-containing protein [Candidatus Tectimicrobiota bacterium]